MFQCFAASFLAVLFCGLATPSFGQNKPTKDLATLVAAQQGDPNNAEDKRAVEDAVDAGLPDQINPTLLSALPVGITPHSDDLGIIVVPKPYLATRAIEPQHGQTFTETTYLYQLDTKGGLRLFCRVHYTVSGDASLAGRMAALLALAHRTLTAHTGYTPLDDDLPFDVWLCRNGEAGGEQWDRNIYFYDLDAKRSSIEWIREIIHEYSHLALPPIGGYTAPEYWANGYLGERLIIRWLQKDPNGPSEVQRAWGDFSGAANFDRILLAPAEQLYKQVGENSKWLARTDADGMRYLIGQALEIDTKYGGHAIGAIFAKIPRAREAKAFDWSVAVGHVTHERMAVSHR